MEESHDGYKLLRGVRVDIKTLLTNFEKTGSVRFSDFRNEWKSMKFSLIFRERKNLPELIEHCEEVLHIAKGYLEPPWNFHIRVGALFTLYGLYFKQPVMGLAKIRFTKDEWEHMCGFIEECKSALHYDICFVHLKLFVHGAYVFTIVPRATGFERGFRKYQLKSSKNAVLERISNRSEIIDLFLLESLATMESLYSEKKEEILGKKNLEFVEKDFALNLKKKIEDFKSKIQTKLPGQSAKVINKTTTDSNSSEFAAPDTSNENSNKNDAQHVIQAKPSDTIYQKEIKVHKAGTVKKYMRKNKKQKISQEPMVVQLSSTEEMEIVRDLPEL